MVSDMEIIDVTPKSFSISWVTSEPSTAGLTVYQSGCTTQISEGGKRGRS